MRWRGNFDFKKAMPLEGGVPDGYSELHWELGEAWE